MNTISVKVEKVNIGLYDVDSIVVNINNTKTEICFSKKDNISKFQGKEVLIIRQDGKYIIQEKVNLKQKQKTK